MIVIDWNPLVNNNFSLEGNYGLQDGYVQELQFESGKKRTWLKNSYIPIEYSSLNLILDNKTPKENGKTEYKEFLDWFNIDLRYGLLPFSITRLSFKRKWDTKQDELGTYKFIANSVKYDKVQGVVLVTFGLEEIYVTPEVEYTFLAANEGQMLSTNSKQLIVA